MSDDQKSGRQFEKRLRGTAERKNVVGERVREKRKAIGLAAEELAAQIEMDTEGRWTAGGAEIYKIESGRRAVTDIEVLALAKALQCRPCFLLVGE